MLIVGAGTGLDLPHLPEGLVVLATDLTPAMLEKCARQKLAVNMELSTRVMNGQAMELPDEAFDAVILHLIVAVIPDHKACLKEVDSVLKPGGKIAVFDKFVSKPKTGWPRKLLNLVTRLLFSDITRNFYHLSDGLKWDVLSDEPANFGGNFRILFVEKHRKSNT